MRVRFATMVLLCAFLAGCAAQPVVPSSSAPAAIAAPLPATAAPTTAPTPKPTAAPTPRPAAPVAADVATGYIDAFFARQYDPELTAKALRSALTDTKGQKVYLHGSLLGEGLAYLRALPCAELTVYVRQETGDAPFNENVLQGLADMGCIADLSVYMPNMWSLTPLASMPALHRLSLDACDAAMDFAPLASLTNLAYLSVQPQDAAMAALAQVPELGKTKGVFEGCKKPNDLAQPAALLTQEDVDALIPFTRYAQNVMASPPPKGSGKPVVVGQALVVTMPYPPNDEERVKRADTAASEAGLAQPATKTAWAEGYKNFLGGTAEAILLGPAAWREAGKLSARVPQDVETIVYIYGRNTPDGDYEDGTHAFDCTTYVRVYNLRDGVVYEDKKIGKINGPRIKYVAGDCYAPLDLPKAYAWLETLALDPQTP